MEEEPKCSVCGKPASEDKHFSIPKMLCRKHSEQMMKYGRITDPSQAIKRIYDLSFMIGKKYNRLLVVGIADFTNSRGVTLLKCLCDCQVGKPENEIKWVYATRSQLERGVKGYSYGVTKSCGCLRSELFRERAKRKKYNDLDLSGEYGIGHTSNGYEFYFDLDDAELISQYTWHKHQDGYLRTCYYSFSDENGKVHNKYIMMHQLIGKTHCLYNPDLKEELDHINGRPYDNRKENLRCTTHMQNMKNGRIKNINTSGHKGVSFCKLENKWKAYIVSDKIKHHLGTFATKEEAIAIRIAAEKEYFGQYNRATEYL